MARRYQHDTRPASRPARRSLADPGRDRRWPAERTLRWCTPAERRRARFLSVDAIALELDAAHKELATLRRRVALLESGACA